MSEQLSLAGFGAAPPPKTDRLFLAIFPGADTAERIAHLARHLGSEHGLRGRPLATERFHVTLLHINDYAGLPQRIVDTAIEAAATVAMPPFEVAFDRVASFSGRVGNRPLVLRGGDGVSALTAFQAVLDTAIKKAGVRVRTGSHYTPHVTLLYDDGGVTEQVVDPVSWTVQEFVLVHSLLGQTRHVPLARFPLLP
jgi:RNA 2',3'-cyclic 3'-phosphodiesterase